MHDIPPIYGLFVFVPASTTLIFCLFVRMIAWFFLFLRIPGLFVPVSGHTGLDRVCFYVEQAPLCLFLP